MKANDTLVINPKSILGKTGDTSNRDWRLFVDYVSNRYVYCSQTKYDKENKLCRDVQLLQGVLVLDPNNCQKAYIIRKTALSISGSPDEVTEENTYIKNHPEEFYTVEK
jgi:hypothetical protein